MEIEVPNPSGLHARPAATFVKAANGFRCDVTLSNVTGRSDPANAKSIIAVLKLGVARGNTIRIEATGDDEDAAVESLRALVATGIGESIGG